MAQKTKKPKTTKAPAITAAKRIEMLEQSNANLKKMIEILAEELDKLSQGVVSLGKRFDASLNVAAQGELNDAKVDEYLMNQQIIEFKNKVDLLIQQGVLVSAETITDENHFVVGKEMSKEGQIVSPRTQVAVNSLEAKIKEQLIGKKTGDLIEFDEDKLSFLIDEVYSINQVEKDTKLEDAPEATQE
jgi:hypothetical protein